MKAQISDQTLLFTTVEKLRWFILPFEVKVYLQNPERIKSILKPPFYPKTYGKSEKLHFPIGSYLGAQRAEISLELNDIQTIQPFKLSNFLEGNNQIARDGFQPSEKKVGFFVTSVR